MQAIQDELFSEEIQLHRNLNNSQIPPPVERFLTYLAEVEPDVDSDDRTSLLNMAVYFCRRDIYHYARVSGLHVLECIMNSALSAVKREQLQEASDVYAHFYLLRCKCILYFSTALSLTLLLCLCVV